MNKSFKSIWNQSLGTWVAAPETAGYSSGAAGGSVVMALALTLSVLAADAANAATTVTLLNGQDSTTAYDTTTGSLTLNIDSGSATQSGAISGAGGLSKTGAGAVLLTGNNSWRGGMQILGGSLRVEKDSALGAAGSAVTANGGHLRLSTAANSQGDVFQRTLNLTAGGRLLAEKGLHIWAGDLLLEGSHRVIAEKDAGLTLTGNISNLGGSPAAGNVQLVTQGNITLFGVKSDLVGLQFAAYENSPNAVLRIENSTINKGITPADATGAALYNASDFSGINLFAGTINASGSIFTGFYGLNNNHRGTVHLSDSTLNGVVNGVLSQWRSITTLDRVSVNVTHQNASDGQVPWIAGVESLIGSHVSVKDSSINLNSVGSKDAYGVMVRVGTGQAGESGGHVTLSGDNRISVHRTQDQGLGGNVTAIMLYPHGSVDVSGKLTIDTNGYAVYNTGGAFTMTDAVMEGTGSSASTLPMYSARPEGVMRFIGSTQGNSQWAWDGVAGSTYDISGLTGGVPLVVGSLKGSSEVKLGANTLMVDGANVDTIFRGNLQDGGEFNGTGSALIKSGTGKLALTGTNTYTGGTTVLDGTLIAGSAGALVQNTPYTINGGTLDVGSWDLKASSFSGAGGTVALNAQTLTVDQVVDSQFAGTITGSGALVKQGAGALTLSGNSDFSGGTALKTGRLNVGSSTALGTGSLSMDEGTTLGFAADGVQLANDIVFTSKNDPFIDTGRFNATIAGSISGPGAMTKQGTGVLTLSGNNTYGGATEVAQGSLQAGAVNTFSALSKHRVAAGATLNLAGHDQVVAGLNNSGVVKLSGAAPGAVFKVTGPYVGNNGVLAVSTVLGGDGSASDKLLLSGAAAVASGTTSVQVSNAGGLGAQTTGKGIELVATDNGASLQPGSFTLAGEHVDAGAFEYRLVQDAQGAALHSTAAPPAPNLEPNPPAELEPSPPPPPAVTAYRGEVPLLSAMPAQLRQADLAMLGDLHKRMGDATSDSVGDSAANRRAWGRILLVDPRIQQQGTVSPESRGRMTGFQAGLDLYANRQIKAGLYVGQLEGDMSVNGFASGVVGKNVGFNNLRSRYLGVYGTWQHESGLYADAVLQAADYRSQLFTSGNGNVAMTKGRGWLASLEMGKPFVLSSQWTIEPQAQLIYHKLKLDDTALSMATVKNQADSDWTLRLGARVKGNFATSAGVLQPYARINIYKSSSITDIAQFNTPAAATQIRASGSYTSTELAAGASLQINPRVGIYGELGKLWSSGGDSRVKIGVQAAVGVKVLW